MIKEWRQGFHKCTIDTTAREFVCELADEPFDENKSFLDIVYDILKDKPKPIEILYSGGKDSELILYCCMLLKIPYKVITMEISVSNRVVNTHDMYYAQKFCHENNISANIVKLDAGKLFYSGDYLDTLNQYNISFPHVACHFYAIEKCDSFPIIGGYWPWVQVKSVDSVLSPIRLDFSCYEEFYKSKNITGIGNFLSHNLEITHYLCKKHIKHYVNGDDESTLKYKMYKEIIPNIEPRYKSMGWELKIPEFTMQNYELKLRHKQTKLHPIIKWGNSLQELLDTSLTSNNKFK